MMRASSTLNKTGEACSMGALTGTTRHQRGGKDEPLYLLPLLSPGAHLADHQAHRSGHHKTNVESKNERTEGLIHRPQSLNGQGVGYARAVETASPGENAVSKITTGNMPSVIQVSGANAAWVACRWGSTAATIRSRRSARLSGTSAKTTR